VRKDTEALLTGPTINLFPSRSLVFTPQFLHVMGGEKSPGFQRFINLSCQAYNIIRRYGNVIIILFQLVRTIPSTIRWVLSSLLDLIISSRCSPPGSKSSSASRTYIISGSFLEFLDILLLGLSRFSSFLHREVLALNMTEEKAAEYFTTKIYESLKTKRTQFNDAIHILANKNE